MVNTYKSDVFESIHSSITAMLEIGAIDKKTMRELYATCIAEVLIDFLLCSKHRRKSIVQGGRGAVQRAWKVSKESGAIHFDVKRNTHF